MKLSGTWITDGALDNHVDAFLELQEDELRDLFAAFALAGLASGEDIGESITWVATTAYAMADAMLAQRSGRLK